MNAEFQGRRSAFASFLAAGFLFALVGSVCSQVPFQTVGSIGLGFPETVDAGVACALVEGPHGALYGTARGGEGAIFKVNKDGTGYSTLHFFTTNTGNGFQPFGAVVFDSNGVMYGSTMRGGTANGGVVYRIRYDGTGYRILHDFTAAPTDGFFARGPLVICSDGRLYGTTQHGGRGDDGTVFRLFPDGTGYEVLYHFDGETGSWAYSGLVYDTDNVYGITQFGGRHGRGVVYRVSQGSGSFEVLHHFGGVAGDGLGPTAKLSEDSDGYLYGTTADGGLGGNGTVFKTKKDGSDHQVLCSFDLSLGQGRPDGEVIVGSDGALFGSTVGQFVENNTLFRIEKDGAGFSVLTSGVGLRGGLVEASDGFLYGAPQTASIRVFRIAKDGAGLTNIFDVARNRRIEAAPRAAVLVGTDQRLYATAEMSGTPRTNAGVILSLALNGSDYQILHDFSDDPLDGKVPNGLTATDLRLYGTTQAGGISNAGTIFRIGRDGQDYELLRDFRPGVEGRIPRRLIEASDGALYGITTSGGASGGGTIFKFDPVTGNLTVLRHLSIADGQQSRAGLLELTNGALYGTAAVGGSSSRGTIFRIDTDGSDFAVLHSFAGGSADGHTPLEGVTVASDGLLYGTTQGGGANAGTIYAVRPDGSDFRILRSFEPRLPDGWRPTCRLVEARDGSLVGTTPQGGRYSRGTIFKINKDGTGYMVLWHFPGAPDGSGPLAGLSAAADGSFYGTTEGGGEMFVGSIYRVDPVVTGLRIETQPVGLKLTWPMSSTADQLEETPSLSSPAWSPVDIEVTTNSSSYTVELPITPSNRLFRVRRAWSHLQLQSATDFVVTRRLDIPPHPAAVASEGTQPPPAN